VLADVSAAMRRLVANLLHPSEDFAQIWVKWAFDGKKDFDIARGKLLGPS